MSLIFFVLAAAAARITTGAESKNSRRWCSPIPKLESPAWSAYSILVNNYSKTSAPSADFWVVPDAKLSIPISITLFFKNYILSPSFICAANPTFASKATKSELFHSQFPWPLLAACIVNSYSKSPLPNEAH
ncbi:hypothetical protein [Pedobacter sp. CFBP9032]|uniref:hypothetical protein n=1 Tax=Pedobacter sp. CFBP9032 TaxID=3096539 RepID=UPI002A6A49AF|nr:hypothetical protein [Pedobacter sp. CFBP9032]MDY0904801.1 hypothetical protein [Pedobacter sp. CFBP9032]